MPKTKIQTVLNNLVTRNERIFRVALQQWMGFAQKQIQGNLIGKFKKDVTSSLTDWDFIEDQGKRTLKPATLKIMQSGGNAAYKQLAVVGSFDILNVRAVGAADKFCAKLVKGVTANTKKGVRTYIREGIKAGKSMSKIAKELRPLVGLTGRQTESIIDYRRLLGEKHPELSVTQVDKKVMTYTDRTHRRRMENIARTETARAQNIGYCQGLEEVGVVEAEFQIAATDYCDECLALNHTRYPVAEAAGVVPVHPRCRCAMLPVVGDETITETLASAPPELPGAMASEEGLMPWKRYLGEHTGEKSTSGLLYDWYKLRYETTGKITGGTKKYLRAHAAKFEATSIKISKPIPGLEDIIKPIKIPPGPKPIKIPVPKPKPVAVKPTVPKPKPEITIQPAKANGLKFTDDDVVNLRVWSNTWHEPVVQAQLGKPIPSSYFMTRKEALKVGERIEASLLKLPGQKGTYHRGIVFKTKEEQLKFLKRCKPDAVYKCPAIQSTSADSGSISYFAGTRHGYNPANGVIMHMEGVSARSVAKYSIYPKEKEFLFLRNTHFKVVKVQKEAYGLFGEKTMTHVYMKEVTKKAVPKPILPTKFRTAEDYRKALLDLAAGKIDPLEQVELKVLVAKRRALDKKVWDMTMKRWKIREIPGNEAEVSRLLVSEKAMSKEVSSIYTKEAALKVKQKVSLKEMRALLNEENNMAGIMNQHQVKKWGDVADDILAWLPKKALSVAERNNIEYFGTYIGRKSSSLQGSYTRSSHSLNMFVNTKKVFAHEFGHHLSYQIKGAYKKQAVFFRARTAGEAKKKLPGYSEIFGKKNKFGKYDYYAGRVYKNGDIPECISVGLEYVWKNPLAAARKDPEWFRMVMSALKKIPTRPGAKMPVGVVPKLIKPKLPVLAKPKPVLAKPKPVATKAQRKWEDSLSVKDKEEIWYYGKGSHADLRAAELNRSGLIPDWRSMRDARIYRKDFYNIIKDAPPTKLKVFRGSAFNEFEFARKDYVVGKIVKFKTTTSSTSSEAIAKKFMRSHPKKDLMNREVRYLFEIDAKTAVDFRGVSVFKVEKELILRKGTRYEVKKVIQEKGFTRVILKEIEPGKIPSLPKLKPKVPSMPKPRTVPKELTVADEKVLHRYTTEEGFDAVSRAQRGLKLDPVYFEISTKEALALGDKIQIAAMKLKATSGKTYRGLSFTTKSEQRKFLNQFKVGKTWESKTLQSTTKMKGYAQQFLEETAAGHPRDPAKGVLLNIKHKTGRSLVRFSDNPDEAEILLMKGSKYKVIKIVDNEVFLVEI